MKRIGNILSIAWMMSVFGSEPLHIALYDTRGMPVSYCIQGTPYTLHISLHNLPISSQLSFALPDGWRMHPGKTVKRHIEQGNVTITYIYTISPERVGSHILGPLQVEANGDIYTSNRVTIPVKEKDETAATAVPMHAILVCNVPVTQAYVGQEISCYLQFCYIPNQISLEQIGKPDIADAVMSSWSGPYSGNKEINGITYEYIEWRWSIRFSKPGNYQMPAYRADYIDFTKKNHSTSQFDIFFNTNALQTLYSNTQRILVKPLPYDASNTQAIGTISAYTMHCDKAECSEGDAVVLSLQIVGQGNFADIDAPRLIDIPSSIKYYNSKKEVIYNMLEPAVCFEYIVQPMQEGIWHIPAQQYTYFDPNDASYKTISTDEIVLTVLPKQIIAVSDTSDQVCTNDTGLCALRTDLLLHEKMYYIPWPLFFLFASLPILLIISYSLCGYYRRYYESNISVYAAKTAFTKAKKHIKTSKKASRLYHIFVRCFADRWMIDTQLVTELYIYTKVKDAGLPKNQLQEWELFWQACMHAAFVSGVQVTNEKDTLSARAIQWCEILEQYM